MAWLLLLAALGAAGASWFSPTPQLDADDASELSLAALTGAGVQVDHLGPPAPMVHETAAGRRFDAWQVLAEVVVGGEVEEVELRVQKAAGQLVYVDDLDRDRTGRLLSQAQFDRLQDHRDGSLTDRWVLRNVLAGVAAAAIAAISYLLANRSDPLWSTP